MSLVRQPLGRRTRTARHGVVSRRLTRKPIAARSSSRLVIDTGCALPASSNALFAAKFRKAYAAAAGTRRFAASLWRYARPLPPDAVVRRADRYPVDHDLERDQRHRRVDAGTDHRLRGAGDARSRAVLCPGDRADPRGWAAGHTEPVSDRRRAGGNRHAAVTGVVARADLDDPLADPRRIGPA